jgi:CHAD domain-containing protein
VKAARVQDRVRSPRPKSGRSTRGGASSQALARQVRSDRAASGPVPAEPLDPSQGVKTGSETASRAAPEEAGGSLPSARMARTAVGTGLHHLLLVSLKERWKRYRKRLRSCRQSFSEEAVHDLRVELRRLLSLAELTGIFVSGRRRERTRLRLKKQLDWFGDLRDTQAQLLHLVPLMVRFAAAPLFRDYLLKRERRCLRVVARRLWRFKPSRLKKSVDRIRREIKVRFERGREDQDAHAMRRALGRAFWRVTCLQQRVDAARSDTIHRTRIAFKKYRYMVESLAPLLPGISDRTLQAMHDFQDLMGHIQDMEILLATFEGFVRRDKPVAQHLPALCAELERRRQAALRAYFEHADRLLEFRPAAFWEPAGRPTAVADVPDCSGSPSRPERPRRLALKRAKLAAPTLPPIL